MSDKRISALTEQTGLNTGDFLAIDNAGESESKKIDQAYFSGQYADMNNILGSKNLMPNNAVTVVLRGVTWTINSDGTIKANGTASGGDSTLYYVSSSNDSTEGVTIPEGKYTYTCLTSAGSDTTFRSEIYNLTNPARIGWDYGEGVTFTRTAATKVLGSINIKSGTTVTNEIFKPMLRPAAVADPTYVPYAKSNKELTEDVASLNASLSERSDLTTLATKSGTTTLQFETKTVQNINDFKYIMVCVYISSGDDCRYNPCIIPVSVFKALSGIPYGSSYGVNTVAQAKYIDDTHVALACYNQNANYASVFVAGIK